jgi:hypothetical protein
MARAAKNLEIVDRHPHPEVSVDCKIGEHIVRGFVRSSVRSLLGRRS